MKKKRAFLKWAGGKYTLTDKIRQALPKGSKLIEPFVGAGAVFLNTDYEHYLLNDINPDLIGIYNTLKRKPVSYIQDTKRFFSAHNNTESAYYALRQRFNTTTDTYERALLFLYLNRHGYNGLCRYNSTGGFNVPFGRYKKPYFPEAELEFFAEKSKKATFTCESFEKTFARARKGHVIYCDPPYLPLSNTANFTNYASPGFGLEQQTLLQQKALHAAQNKQIPVLLSNHDTEFARQLYEGAQLTSIQVNRFIGPNQASRRKVSELLVYYSPQAV